MTETNDSEKSAFEVLLPPSVKVMYGGKERELKPLSVKTILEITLMLSKKLSLFFKEWIEEEKDFYEKFVACIGHVEEKDIIRIIALVLNCTEEEARKGFRAYDAIKVFEIVLEYEDIEKIFFVSRQIAEKMSRKSEKSQSTG